MLKAFIEKIESMAAPVMLDINGRDYSSRQIYPVHYPKVETLEVGTLNSIVDYIRENPDLYKVFIIHIESPTEVSLRSPIFGCFKERERILVAIPEIMPFNFGQWMTVEEFIIALQAQFIGDENTAAILKIVGNLNDGTVRTFADDGTTQQVSAKTGIARVGDVNIPNPVLLKPYRTFIEIEQPASKFVFRMKQGPQQPLCMLAEADGGAWRMVAIDEIRRYFKNFMVSETVGVKIHMLV